jgi:hypothetical protein
MANKKAVSSATPSKAVPPPPDVDKKYIVDIFEGVRSPAPEKSGVEGAEDSPARAAP